MREDPGGGDVSEHEGRVIHIEKKTPNELLGTIIEQLAQIFRLRKELKNCRNELCLKCGNYHESYAGACDDCRYRRGGEWEADLHE